MDAGINGDAQRIEQMVWMLFLKVYDAKEDDWELNEDNYESIIPEDLRWRNWAKADGSGHAMTGDKLLNFVNNTLFPVLKGNDVKDGDAVLYEGIKVTPDTPIKKAIVKSTFEDANNYMKDGVYLRQVIDVIDEIEFDDVKESHAFGFVYEEILRELQSAGSSGEFYATAYNVSARFDGDVGIMIMDREKQPFEELEAGKSYELILITHNGSASKFRIITEWTDSSGKQHTKTQMGDFS